MHAITFYLDFISPYAYLAFEALPRVLQGHSVQVSYQPVLFAGLLQHHGQLGPAEVPGKREWTYRQVLWLAQRAGIPCQMPERHPFNPLSLLRLAVATDPLGLPNRHVCERIFHHVWRSGLAADDPVRLQSLQEQLAPARSPSDDSVKAQLRAHTESALAHGVFGVPTMAWRDRLFWGYDALEMLRDALDQHPWFEGPDWDQPARMLSGITRAKR
jgi:2-hydroxychromene-2-carboxylate isomerase